MIQCCLRARRSWVTRAAVLAAVSGVALATGPAVGRAQPSVGSAVGARTLQSSTATSRGGVVVRLHQHLVRVTIHNFTFVPARLVVSPGTQIVWTNRDGDPHTVTSDRGVWASDALDTSSQFARVFKTAGTFPYHCAIHPFMHGSIIVKRSGR